MSGSCIIIKITLKNKITQHLNAWHFLMAMFVCFFCYILASYLPKASCQEYEFVYVDAKGEMCASSSKFTFCAPKPLDDLVTLEEESHGEEGGTDMLLVVPRAELLQVSKIGKWLYKIVKENKRRKMRKSLLNHK